MAVDTIPQKLINRAAAHPDLPAYHVRGPGGWKATSWGEYGRQIKSAAKAFIALGLPVDGKVTMLGFNSPSWVIFDAASMAAGGVPAGIYTTSSPAEAKYILNHSEAPFLLIEDDEQWKKIDSVRAELPHLRHVVVMDGGPVIEDELVMSWDDFMAAGSGVDDAQLQERLDGLSMDGLGTMIYTSGTTGPPKAVMLSHDNLTWTSNQAAGLTGLNTDDRMISYLPLSHIAEQMFTIHAPATAGAQIYYAESIDKLRENMVEVKPTVFFAVPRVWEKFFNGVQAQMAHLEGPKAKLAEWAQSVGRKVADLKNKGDKPSGMLAVQATIAEKLVWSKVQGALGLSEAQMMVSGAAPITPEVLEYLAGFGLIVNEVYGQSEDTGPTTFNVPGRTKFGTVGPAYPGVEVRTADDGEILVRGRNVFMGYYKDEAATKETLIDGWLHSGDLGEFDEEGFLRITGRKKDIIITAGGKNVAPQPMEGGLKNHVLVSEAVVVGDRQKYLTALITLDPEETAAFVAANGITGPAHTAPEVQAEVQRAIDDLNAHLARVEQIKKFTVLPRELSIAEGELTPTLKVKRNKVTEAFAAEIAAMYAD